MPANLQIDSPTNVCELRINGTLRRAEIAECERTLAVKIAAGATPSILAIVENFTGWQRGDDWNNLDFMFNYGDQIEKIAIVGEQRWEAEMKAFTGAGLRRTPVRFFAPEEESEARAWLEP